MIIIISILMLIISLLCARYIKKTVDFTTAIIYEIYALLVISAWVIFVLIIE